MPNDNMGNLNQELNTNLTPGTHYRLTFDMELPIQGDSAGPQLVVNGTFNDKGDSGWTKGDGWSNVTDAEQYSVGAPGPLATPSGISPGSTGYQSGDILTFSLNGDGNATLRITGINEGGEIGNWEMISGGTGYTAGGFMTATGGHGTGAVFNTAYQANGFLYQQIPTVAGVTYSYSFDFAPGPASDTRLQMYRGTSESEKVILNTATTAGTFSGEFTADNDNETIFFYGLGFPFPDPGPWTGTVTNVSVQTIGNHNGIDVLLGEQNVFHIEPVNLT